MIKINYPYPSRLCLNQMSNEWAFVRTITGKTFSLMNHKL